MHIQLHMEKQVRMLTVQGQLSELQAVILWWYGGYEISIRRKKRGCTVRTWLPTIDAANKSTWLCGKQGNG